jgi:hypothetical protein
VSHHLDSPASRRDPRLNVTDVYAFDSDGAAAEQLTYRFWFAPAGAPGAQHVAVDRLAGAEAADDLAAGTRVADGATGAAISGSWRAGLVRRRRRPVLP